LIIPAGFIGGQSSGGGWKRQYCSDQRHTTSWILWSHSCQVGCHGRPKWTQWHHSTTGNCMLFLFYMC